MKIYFIMAAFLGCLASVQAQPINSFQLWPEGAPGALGKEDKDIPTLTPYLPDPGKATGAAIVICPGGGYGMLAPHEGGQYARFLNEYGIAGFVLKYRLGSGGYRHPAMLQDAARAVRTVRARAREWKLDPTHVGIMGSSAGGHLASTLVTHFDAGRLIQTMWSSAKARARTSASCATRSSPWANSLTKARGTTSWDRTHRPS